MNPANAKLPWRGLLSAVRQGIQTGVFPPGTPLSREYIDQFYRQQFPDLPPLTAATARSIFKDLAILGLVTIKAAGVYAVNETAAPKPIPSAKYTGLLLDSDEVLIQLESQTIRLPPKDFRALVTIIGFFSKA